MRYIFLPLQATPVQKEDSKVEKLCIGDYWFVLSSSQQQGQTVCLFNVFWIGRLSIIIPTPYTSHSEQHAIHKLILIDQKHRDRRRRGVRGEGEGEEEDTIGGNKGERCKEKSCVREGEMLKTANACSSAPWTIHQCSLGWLTFIVWALNVSSNSFCRTHCWCCWLQFNSSKFSIYSPLDLFSTSDCTH